MYVLVLGFPAQFFYRGGAKTAILGKIFDKIGGLKQGGHSPGKPGKPGIVREFKSGQGKVREKRKSQGKCVLACGH